MVICQLVSGSSSGGVEGWVPGGAEGGGGDLRCPQLDSMAEVLNVSVEGGCGCHLA